MHGDHANGAVAGVSGLVALAHGIPEGLVSLIIGLVGVALARWVFVNREVRRSHLSQKWNETLPLTLVGMLVTGVLVIDQKLGVSSAAFLGLGVGWAAVLILDVLGERILAAMRGMLSAGPANPTFPPAADLSGMDGRVTANEVTSTSDLEALLVEAGKALDESDASAGVPDRGTSVEDDADAKGADRVRNVGGTTGNEPSGDEK
jgi:hypothetical protein